MLGLDLSKTRLVITVCPTDLKSITHLVAVGFPKHKMKT